MECTTIINGTPIILAQPIPKPIIGANIRYLSVMCGIAKRASAARVTAKAWTYLAAYLRVIHISPKAEIKVTTL